MLALLIGLPERDAAAVSQVIGKAYPDWACQTCPVAPQLPPAEIYVIDVDGCRATLALDWAALPATLTGRAVVLIVPPPSLDEAQAHAESAQAREWVDRGWMVLRRPFGEVGVLGAVQRALKQAHAAAAPAPAPRPRPRAARKGEPQIELPTPLAADRVDESAADDEAARAGPSTVTSSLSSFPPSSALGRQRAPSIEAAPPARLPEMGEGSLTVSAFRIAVAHCPLAEARGFLDALARQLAAGRPFEMVLTMINGLIFEPQADWVASNTPVSVLRMVARSRALSGLVRYVPIDARVDPQARAAQRGMAIYPLEDLLYVLARVTECPLPEAGRE